MAVISVVTSAPPMTEGGHLVLARALERALLDAGHRAGIVITPSSRFGRQASAYIGTWLTDVGVTGTGERVDQVISLRYPSYAVRHPAHVCWLVHAMREYYDLWDRFSAALSPQGRLKERARRWAIHRADTYCFRRVSRMCAISSTVKARVERWNGVPTEAVLPPPPQRDYRCDGYGDYLLFVSRLTPLKRAELVLNALAEPEARSVRCVFAGDGEDRARLEGVSRDLGLESRVTFAGRLSEPALLDHLARCRAVVFPPLDEDYGFVTSEAFASGKAVITCADSGGPLELVRAGENGWVVESEPTALARAMAEAMEAPSLAERLGRQGRADVSRLSWADVIKRLVIVKE
jgi:glycosyltransferase involved in cell wall biosynthesis